MVGTCATCPHWTRPLQPKEFAKFTGRTAVYGECNNTGDMMDTDGPLGCYECDPYTSRSFITKAGFGCNHPCDSAAGVDGDRAGVCPHYGGPMGRIVSWLR